MGNLEYYIIRKSLGSTGHIEFFRTVKSSRRLQYLGWVGRGNGGQMMTPGMHTQFWWGNVFENGHLEDQGEEFH